MTLRDTGVRDEHGMEPMESIFSSPSKSTDGDAHDASEDEGAEDEGAGADEVDDDDDDDGSGEVDMDLTTGEPKPGPFSCSLPTSFSPAHMYKSPDQTRRLC